MGGGHALGQVLAMTVDVAELRRLLASATRRPWATCSEHPGAACSVSIVSGDPKNPDSFEVARATTHRGNDTDEKDAALIAAAVNALEPLLDELQALRGQVAEYGERLLARANEEPPSGWLRPGEDGYENTPEGARQARIRAERALEDLRTAVREGRT